MFPSGVRSPRQRFGLTCGARDSQAAGIFPRFCRHRSSTRLAVHSQRVNDTPGPNVTVGGCTSRQPNTHNTESREVCYPWHPWFGRSVVVYEVLVKYGQSVCRCGLEEERNRRAVEIPTWMFEPAACCRLPAMAVPTVSCDALLELKALLRTAQRPYPGVVLQAPHRSLLAAGGADATVRDPTAILSTDAVSSLPSASVVSDVAARYPKEDDHVAGPTAAPPRRPGSRLRPDAGGV